MERTQSDAQSFKSALVFDIPVHGNLVYKSDLAKSVGWTMQNWRYELAILFASSPELGEYYRSNQKSPSCHRIPLEVAEVILKHLFEGCKVNFYFKPK